MAHGIGSARQNAKPVLRTAVTSRATVTSRFGWSSARIWWSNVLESKWFNRTIGFIVLLNLGAIAHEAEVTASCGSSKCNTTVERIIDSCFLFIYTVELFLRLYVYRLHYFRSGWNIMDFCIVVVGYFDLVLDALAYYFEGIAVSNIAMIRLLRALRVLRSLRLFEEIPELYIMLRSFFHSLKAMMWGLVMVFLLLFMFAILSVELIYPISVSMHDLDEFCPEWYGRIWYCMIMFFQGLVAGDSWGRCAMPVIREAWWTVFIFGGAFACVTLGFMNLILATIVENASESKAASDEEKLMHLKEARLKATENLSKVFRELDADASGTISLEELMEGYETNSQLQSLFFRLDMKREDVIAIFELMDSENNNELSYESLMDNLRLAEDGDHRKSILMLRLQSAECARLNKKISERTNELMRLLRRTESGDGITLESESPKTPRRPKTPGEAIRRAHTFGAGSGEDISTVNESRSLLRSLSGELKGKGAPILEAGGVEDSRLVLADKIGAGSTCKEVTSGTLRPKAVDAAVQIPDGTSQIPICDSTACRTDGLTGHWSPPLFIETNFSSIVRVDAQQHIADPVSNDLGIKSPKSPAGSMHPPAKGIRRI